MSRPAAVLATDEAFWRHGGRAAQICAWLSGQFEVTAFVFAALSPADRALIATRGYPFAVVSHADYAAQAAGAPGLGPGDVHPDLRRWYAQARHDAFQHFVEQSAPAVVITAGLRLHYLLRGLRPGVLTMLDASEILSRHTIIEGAFGDWMESGLSLNDELALMERYSFVLAGNRADHAWLRGLLHPASVVLLPMLPRQDALPSPQGGDAGKLIFAGPDCAASRQGLQWFARHVLPYLPERLHLSVYGGACAAVEAGPRIALHGEIDDIAGIHRDSAVAIDPATLSGAPRIENLEALWAGMPLVTSPEGARGLEMFEGHGLHVARSRQDFCRHILAASTALDSGDAMPQREDIRAAYRQDAECGYFPGLLRQLCGRPLNLLAGRKARQA